MKLFPQKTLEQRTKTLADYLPNGRLFRSKGEGSTNLLSLLTAMAYEIARVDGKMNEIIEEHDPRLTTELLSSWETALGIPDGCFNADGDLEERRSHVLIKLGLAVSTAESFVALAAEFGVDVIISSGAKYGAFDMEFPIILFDTDKDARFTMIADLPPELNPSLFTLIFPFTFSDKKSNIIECLFRKLKPANTDVIFRYSGDATAYDPSVQGVVDEAIMDLDAVYRRSYDGISQSWLNLVPFPFDGNSARLYDFYRGDDASASGTDPTFDGVPDVAANKWTFDGGDYFTAKNAIAGLLSTIHRTDIGQPFTVGFAFKTPATLSAEVTLFSTESSSTAHGCRFRITTSGALGWVQADGSGSFNTNNILGAGAILPNTNYFVLVGLNPSAPGSEKVWKNSGIGASWAASLAVDPDTTDSTSTPVIGATGGHSSALISGYELKNVCLFNKILSDDEALSVIELLKARHRIDYV